MLPEPLFTLSRSYQWLYYLIVWAYHFGTVALAFLPFWIAVKVAKPLRWWHLAIATAGMFLMQVGILFYIDDSILKWDGWQRVRRSDLVVTPFQNALFTKFLFLSSPTFVASAFLSVRLLYGKFTWRRILLAVALALPLLGIQALYLTFIFFLGLSKFVEYF